MLGSVADVLVFHEFAQVDGTLELVVTSRPGSTFRFELPAQLQGEVPAAPAARATPAAAPPIEDALVRAGIAVPREAVHV